MLHHCVKSSHRHTGCWIGSHCTHLYTCLGVVNGMENLFVKHKQSLPQEDEYSQESRQNIAGLQNCDLQALQVREQENTVQG